MHYFVRKKKPFKLRKIPIIDCIALTYKTVVRIQ